MSDDTPEPYKPGKPRIVRLEERLAEAAVREERYCQRIVALEKGNLWRPASEPPPSAERSYLVFMERENDPDHGFISTRMPWTTKVAGIRFERQITHWKELDPPPEHEDAGETDS